MAITGEPGLGYYYGLQLKLSSHGAVGMAARPAERNPLRRRHPQ